MFPRCRQRLARHKMVSFYVLYVCASSCCTYIESHIRARTTPLGHAIRLFGIILYLLCVCIYRVKSTRVYYVKDDIEKKNNKLELPN